MRRNKATFVCGGKTVPASRFRVHPTVHALTREGWDVSLVEGYGHRDQRIRSPIARKAYRVGCRAVRAYRTASLRLGGPVLIQRLAIPVMALPEAKLMRRGVPVVFDFDDAVFLGKDGEEGRLRRRALDKVCANAAHVVAGNSWLAEQVKADVPLTVLPTCIDTELYSPNKVAVEDRLPRVGWIGTSGNLQNLWQIVPSIEKLRRDTQEFEIAICSDGMDHNLFKRLGANFVRWSPSNEVSFLHSLDIGLMPLVDSDWSRGKCSFKLIQYLAVGCPAVGSAVGMNNDVLRGDYGGRLVRGDNWEEPLAELLGDPGLRDRLSRQARSRAVADYDVSVAIHTYRSILERFQEN